MSFSRAMYALQLLRLILLVLAQAPHLVQAVTITVKSVRRQKNPADKLRAAADGLEEVAKQIRAPLDEEQRKSGDDNG